MTKTLLASILISLALFLGLAFVLTKYDQINELQVLLDERIALSESRRQAYANLNNFEQESLRYQADVARMEIFLPQKQKNEEILSAVYSSAIESGVQLNNVSLGTSTQVDGKKIITTPISIDASINYQAVTRFLSSLEASLRVFDITEVTISNDAGGSGFLSNNGLSTNIKLKVYHLQ